MSDLSVVIPSRGRPHAVAEVVEAFRETCTAATQIVLVVDHDDPDRDAYVQAVTDAHLREVPDVTAFGGRERVYIAPRSTVRQVVISHGANMAEALNIGVQHALDGFAVGFMGDDHRPRTKGWDTAYLEALKDLGSGIVYGDDLFQREQLPTQMAMTTDIVRTLGWMTPPGLRHMYLDNFWRDLGAAAGCLRYLPRVVVEHMHPLHPSGAKAAVDDGYRRVNAPEMYEHDRQAYRRYVGERFRQDVAAVRALRGGS